MHGTTNRGERTIWLRRPGCFGFRRREAEWVHGLLGGAAETVAGCPRCASRGSIAAVLDHVLSEHDFGLDDAAVWLEDADRDLFALAVHYLAGRARGVPEPPEPRRGVSWAVTTGP